MPKKEQKSNYLRSETTVVRGTITTSQQEIIQGLIGVLGSNEQDVVSKILTLWMYNEGFLKRKGHESSEV
ncbi:MAG: hypothetical protein AABW89_02450 [Nanoarchaeota archaeon]